MNPMLKIKLKKNKNKSLKNFENESEFFFVGFHCLLLSCKMLDYVSKC